VNVRVRSVAFHRGSLETRTIAWPDAASRARATTTVTPSPGSAANSRRNSSSTPV